MVVHTKQLRQASRNSHCLSLKMARLRRFHGTCHQASDFSAQCCLGYEEMATLAFERQEASRNAAKQHPASRKWLSAAEFTSGFEPSANSDQASRKFMLRFRCVRLRGFWLQSGLGQSELKMSIL